MLWREVWGIQYGSGELESEKERSSKIEVSGDMEMKLDLGTAIDNTLAMPYGPEEEENDPDLDWGVQMRKWV